MSRLVTTAAVWALAVSVAWAQPPAENGADPERLVGSAQSDVPKVRTFASLVLDLGGDLRGLGSREAVIWMAAAGGASLSVLSGDRQITRRTAGSAGLEQALGPGNLLGSGPVQLGGAFATFLIARAIEHPRASVIGADLARAQLMNAGITQAIKVGVRRERPDGTPFSFPSGHTSSAFATAAVLQRHLGWRAGAPAYGLAAYIGASRMSANRHYPSDVIFGAALGIVAGRAATIRREDRVVVIAPMAGRRAAGVQVTIWTPAG